MRAQGAAGMTDQADLFRAVIAAADALRATLDPDDYLRSPMGSLAGVCERRIARMPPAPIKRSRRAAKPTAGTTVVDLASRRPKIA
jgi:hypothetical protein